MLSQSPTDENSKPPGTHFLPSSELFSHKEKGDVMLLTTCWCIMLASLLAMACAFGPLQVRDGSGSGSGRIPAGFEFYGFGFGDGFSPTVFGFGIGFGFGFDFSPVDIQWIFEINHLELKLMFYKYANNNLFT
jgi:hypothetical protein